MTDPSLRPQSSALVPVFSAVVAIGAGLFGSLYCLWGDALRGGAGLALSVAALAWPRSFWRVRAAAAWTPAQRGGAALAVVATLVFFRCYRLVPPGLWGDDAINGLLAFDVLDGKVASPFTLIHHAHSYFHALPNYAIAAAFQLFGPGPEALRIPGVIAGILAGVFYYAALLPLFGGRVALVAGLFFASSPLQISHAKNLIQGVFGLTFQCAGIAFAVAAVTARRRALVVPAAAALAGTLYTYHAAKVAPLAVVPYLLACARGVPARGCRRAALLAAAVFALCLLPAVLSYVADPGKLTGRFTGVSLLGELRATGSLRPLIESVARNLAIFHYQQGPPRYHWFGPGDEPALNPIVAFLAVHGLVVSLRNWREPRHVLLLAWFAIGIIPGIFSSEAPRGYRVLLAMPPLYAWAALPVIALWCAPAAGLARGALRCLAAALVAGSLFVDFNYYFYRVYTRQQVLWMQGERQVAMARALHRRGPGWRAHLLSPSFAAEYESLRFLARAWDLRFVDVSDLGDILPLQDLPEAGALFITTPGTNEAEVFLRAFYPNAQQERIYDPKARSWFFGGHWPYSNLEPRHEPVATLIAVRREELARALNRRGPRALPVVAEYDFTFGRRVVRREPPPFFNFFVDTFPHTFAARWTATLLVPAPGGYALSVRGEGEVETRIDGAVVADGHHLAAGRHHIEIRIPEVVRRVRLAVWWTPPRAARTLVPPQAWLPARQARAAPP